MIRGTTAPFRFKLPFQKSELRWVTIKFWQDGNLGSPEGSLPITKKLVHCSSTADDSYELYVVLDEAETMQFSDQTKAKVQLRAQAHDGTTFASRQQSITVYPINDDIIGDDDPGEFPDVNDEGLVILDGSAIMAK